MKQISAALEAHLQAETTTLATCWRLKRRDGVILGFTDHDLDIDYEDLLYKASTGFTPSAVESSASLKVDNLEVEGMLASGSITEADILAGKYDFAEIEIFWVNYKAPEQGALKLRRGWLGEVSLCRQQFVAEVRGLTQSLSQTIGELYSPACRATLGDARCKVNLASHTVTGNVTSALSMQEFIDTARTEDAGYFHFGVITFTSGQNAGLSTEIKEYIAKPGGGQVVLALPMPYALEAGDCYAMSRGCDKTMDSCHVHFNNVANFRGEPHVPGLDRMLETAGTRSQW